VATPLPDSAKPVSLQISLSPAQQDQIRQIFELFDTDGGGSIDRSELEFAMTALGFHSQNNHAANLLDTIAGDGRVTLVEFSSLMTGEVLGSNQIEDVQAVFAALSKPDEESRHNNLITLRKLQDACQKFKVCANLQLFVFCFSKMSECIFVFLDYFHPESYRP
jgi:Ca2+-binding EF-hand superfamily protein